jgi:hypothetical protein
MCEVDPGRPAGISTGGFPRVASRTRRASRPGTGLEPVDHGLGRSRGGLTTKLHLACEQGQKVMSLVLTAGQRGDSPQFAAVLERIGCRGLVLAVRARHRIGCWPIRRTLPGPIGRCWPAGDPRNDPDQG